MRTLAWIGRVIFSLFCGLLAAVFFSAILPILVPDTALWGARMVCPAPETFELVSRHIEFPHDASTSVYAILCHPANPQLPTQDITVRLVWMRGFVVFLSVYLLQIGLSARIPTPKPPKFLQQLASSKPRVAQTLHANASESGPSATSTPEQPAWDASFLPLLAEALAAKKANAASTSHEHQGSQSPSVQSVLSSKVVYDNLDSLPPDQQALVLRVLGDLAGASAHRAAPHDAAPAPTPAPATTPWTTSAPPTTTHAAPNSPLENSAPSVEAPTFSSASPTPEAPSAQPPGPSSPSIRRSEPEPPPAYLRELERLQRLYGIEPTAPDTTRDE